MFAELFTPEQLTILTQIILIDLVLAGDNAIIIGMVASKFPLEQRKKIYIFWNWWSGSFKNYSYITYSIFIANNWFKASWWSSFTLYRLQTLYRRYQGF